ncbi:hemicentin-1-like isoform X2 [Hypomesus transpacificus]|uniref:hemicentin-1-like isoform X2 n=1 Tax=Hypomesus transpacificus TaxID=137520 RepID=UPI001F087C25|nr:hemicentin-1-like isoform X2 [Hypomesus transpacificus]
MVQLSLCLPLLLTCLTGTTASEGAQSKTANYGPSFVEITGVSIVTVGIPYAFQCSATCSPACTFSWTRGNQTAQGPELRLELQVRVQPQVLICVALNPATGESVTVKKTLQVTEGPSDIIISGPDMLSNGQSSTFTCLADCYPSCLYTWTVGSEGQSTGVTSEGSSLTITPPSDAMSEKLTCQAQNSVSHLFISKTTSVWVATGPDDISISNQAGSNTVILGSTYKFFCIVYCTPSCNYTWTYNGHTYPGDQIQVPILHKGDKRKVMSKLVFTISDYTHTENLTCKAQNTISGLTIVTTATLTVIDPISVQPVSSTLPVAGQVYSLHCVGSQNPASILWTKDAVPLPVSSRVSLSLQNTTLSFSPLQQSDGGLYQCVVSQGGQSLKGIGYQLNVYYGPVDVAIVRPEIGPVGPELYVSPGSTTGLLCSSECYPNCSYTWIYNGKPVALKAAFSLTSGTPVQGGPLTCVANNPVTKENSSSETMVIPIDGPSNVTISGPRSLDVGVKATFRCSAQCSPSCSFTWTVYGHTMTGSTVDVTVSRYVPTESLSCEAHNSVTGRTASVNETLSVSDPHWCGC